ncbi:hypothetical protein ACLOJK_014061 [Asimina triloba]
MDGILNRPDPMDKLLDNEVIRGVSNTGRMRMIKLEPLEGDVAPERSTLTMKEAVELEVFERGRNMVSKRPLAPIKEEVMTKVVEEPTKKKK